MIDGSQPSSFAVSAFPEAISKLPDKHLQPGGTSVFSDKPRTPEPIIHMFYHSTCEIHDPKDIKFISLYGVRARIVTLVPVFTHLFVLMQ